MAGYDVVNPTTGFPVFAFRLHQFLSRGDTVYASPEPADDPATSRSTGSGSCPGDRNRTLLPLAFCRACGQDYYVVRQEAHDTGTRLVPRDLGEMGADRGHDIRIPLHVGRPAMARRRATRCCAGSPTTGSTNGASSAPTARTRCPAASASVPTANWRWTTTIRQPTAWWSPTPFRFCLACGVAYAGRVGRDFGRLDHPRLGGSLDGHDRHVAGRHSRAARRHRAERRRQEAPVVHRQPPGRVTAGRPLQRLRPGHPAARRTVACGRRRRASRASPTTRFRRRCSRR